MAELESCPNRAPVPIMRWPTNALIFRRAKRRGRNANGRARGSIDRAFCNARRSARGNLARPADTDRIARQSARSADACRSGCVPARSMRSAQPGAARLLPTRRCPSYANGCARSCATTSANARACQKTVRFFVARAIAARRFWPARPSVAGSFRSFAAPAKGATSQFPRVRPVSARAGIRRAAPTWFGTNITPTVAQHASRITLPD